VQYQYDVIINKDLEALVSIQNSIRQHPRHFVFRK